MKKTVVLAILDGWGLGSENPDNAVFQASTPVVDGIRSEYPSASLITHGVDVGLPAGQMGNSEVGHMNIGAGRVVEMDLRRIDLAIEENRLSGLPGIRRFVEAMQASGGTAHLFGLLSDGGVHSHQAHMVATARVLMAEGIPVSLHLAADGRDVAPKSAPTYLDQLCASLPDGVRIATLCGRYFVMDRNNQWDRIAAAYEVIVQGRGPVYPSAYQAISESYDEEISDEFIRPARLNDYNGLQEGDGFLCLNFRADRARQFLAALGDPSFSEFPTEPRPDLAILSGFAEYSAQHNSYMDSVFPDQDIKNTLGEWVSANGLRQLRIAETEKYPHVTYFFNGGIELPSQGESRVLVPSPNVATYDLQPQMSADGVTKQLLAGLRSCAYDLIVVNYANPDMVGHSGDFAATVAACEFVDRCLGLVVDEATRNNAILLVTADHGNCEVMVDPTTAGPHTSHTTNQVPVCLVNGPKGATLRKNGRLADLAPTLLDLLDMGAPPEMTGQSLLRTLPNLHDQITTDEGMLT